MYIIQYTIRHESIILLHDYVMTLITLCIRNAHGSFVKINSDDLRYRCDFVQII